MTTLHERTVVEARGLQWAISRAVIEHVLLQRPGFAAVDANPVAQTATVSYDPSVTSVQQISGWIRDCGYHCWGQAVPDHVCYPMEATVPTPGTRHDAAGEGGAGQPPGHVHFAGTAQPMEHMQPTEPDQQTMHPCHAPETTEPHPGHARAATDSRAGHGPGPHGDITKTPRDMMGHGGHHTGMSMDAMVKDMRHRFLLAAFVTTSWP